MTELERVIEFAKSESIMFDKIYFECEWNGFNVYSPSFDVEGNYFVSLPNYILVNKQGIIRRSKDNEVYEILENLPDEDI